MPQLREYQLDLINRVRQAYKQGFKRPCIVLPCGGGKSCITAEIAKCATEKGKKVLFLVHRRELVDQIRQTFYSWGVDLSQCRVEMVQTACRRLHKMPTPDLIITDENHHCIASSYKKIYAAYPAAQCLGVTATPIRLNGGGLGEINDKLIVGVTAEWLIANNYLAPYDYYAVNLADMERVRTKNGDYDRDAVMMQLGKATIYGDVVATYKSKANGCKAICYCTTVAHSKEMACRFSAAGIPAAHIDGKTEKRERARIVDQFRTGEIKILCNVDLISEGFDVPDCTCAILLRPTKSLTLYIQQSMRAMRYQPGKRAIIIDHVGNYGRFGMPDDAREWSLDPQPEKKKMVQDNIRQCPKCYYTFKTQSKCPSCGNEEFEGQRKVEEDATVEIQEIKKFVVDYTTPEDCKSYKDLLNYAQTHGYKRGWAWYQAKARGFIKN